MSIIFYCPLSFVFYLVCDPLVKQELIIIPEHLIMSFFPVCGGDFSIISFLWCILSVMLVSFLLAIIL
jgi:hypothetical protein